MEGRICTIEIPNVPTNFKLIVMKPQYCEDPGIENKNSQDHDNHET